MITKASNARSPVRELEGPDGRRAGLQATRKGAEQDVRHEFCTPGYFDRCHTEQFVEVLSTSLWRGWWVTASPTLPLQCLFAPRQKQKTGARKNEDKSQLLCVYLIIGNLDNLYCPNL